MVEVEPSPKFQTELAGTGVDVFEKLIVELIQMLSGALNVALIFWIFRRLTFLRVSEHPPLLVVARLTV